MTAPLKHAPVPGDDFMPDGWCGACETCTSAAPTVCVACSYPHGGPDTPIAWPCQHAPKETIR